MSVVARDLDELLDPVVSPTLVALFAVFIAQGIKIDV